MRQGFNIVIGGQAGSESKGKLSAWLCDKYRVDGLFMASSPNAGHTVMVSGEKYVSYHLPAGVVVSHCPIFLGPSSLINPDTLEREIKALRVDPSRINIHSRAAVITPGHMSRECEGGLSDIGSTLQGVGECRAGKMGRGPGVTYVGDMPEVFANMGVSVGDTVTYVNTMLAEGKTILCEMTQGFDLDLEHGIHRRYCTSKMINPAMAMAEAGVSPYWLGSVYGVIRPFPIRVNNRTGTSGPYADAEEITWSIVTQECNAPSPIREMTTTTKLSRRVFRFSWERYRRFIMVCQPTSICLQFANYVSWGDYAVKNWSELTTATKSFIKSLEIHGVPVEFIGTGPDHGDMIHVPVGILKFPTGWN